MSFFQLLTNAYVPFNQKLIKDNISLSFANAAYNSCHPLVAKTIDASTAFKKKAALEIMFYLIGIGLDQLTLMFGNNTEELNAVITKFAVNLTLSMKEDVYYSISKNGQDVRNFCEEKIEDYLRLLKNIDLHATLLVMMMFIDKPLLTFKEAELALDSSRTGKNLELSLQIQLLIKVAAAEMRNSINKMYIK